MTPIFDTTRALSLLAFAALPSVSAAQEPIARVPAPRAAIQDVKTPAPAAPLRELLPEGAARAASAMPSPAAPQAKLPAAARAHAFDREELHYDERDGAIWVRGTNWKASFTRDAATFIPLFGAKAPQNYPITFTLDGAERGDAPVALVSAHPAERTGARVDIDRGGLVERYDMAPDHLEQSFVFESLPAAAGDLVVRLNVETELAMRPDGSGGIDFSNDLGRVHYGGAKVFDAAGREEALVGVLEDGRYELRVSESFLAGATFPVVVDPVLLVFTVDDSGDHDYDPDVAFDALSNRYIVVYEEEASATDHDVYTRIFNGSGTLLSGAYVDVTTQDWREPSVANNALNSEFLVAASVKPQAGALWRISGRTVKPSTHALGAVTQISENIGYDMFHPTVGGDGTFTAPVYYLVVYQRNFSSSDTDVHARLVAPGGANVGAPVYIDDTGGTLDFLPQVSKSDGAAPSTTQEWSVVWSRVKNANDWDVYGAQLSWDASILDAPYAIDTSTNDDRDVEVSSILDGGNSNFVRRPHMVVLTRGYDVVYSVFRGAAYVTSGNLSDLEQNGLQSEIQWLPVVETDGHKFAIAYTESYQGTSDMDTWITTVELAGNEVIPSEIHQQLGYTTYIESAPALASRHGGGGGEWDFWAVWQTLVPPSYEGDIDAAVFSAPVFTSICNPEVDAIACPCGNSPAVYGRGCENSAGTGGAHLAGVGAASADTVVLTASSMLPSVTTVFLQGTSYLGWQGGAPFGDGVRCIGGQILRLAIKQSSGGTASFPQFGDPSIQTRSSQLGAPIALGSQRYYQAYYRDPASFACAGNATFNTTNGILITW
jgi:hypothetical protein